MDSQLKPCPHCGGTDIRIGFNYLEERHYALCRKCRMRGPEKCGDEDRAIKVWNDLPRGHDVTPNSVDCAGMPGAAIREPRP